MLVFTQRQKKVGDLENKNVTPAIPIPDRVTSINRMPRSQIQLHRTPIDRSQKKLMSDEMTSV